MSTVPVFNRVYTSVYVLSTLADAGLSTYWAGYIASPGSDLGASAGTAAVWQDIGGFYLFLDKTPADWAAFMPELSALRPNLGPPNTVRCVWIVNADGASSQWQITVAAAKAAGSGATITWTLMRGFAFNIGSYSLSFSGMSALAYIADDVGGGIEFTGSVMFSGPGGSYTFTSAAIPFSGTTLGAFTGTMAVVPPSGAEENDVWTSLNIGLQYAVAPPLPPENTDDVQDENETDWAPAYVNATRLLFMPVFTTQTETVNFGITFDPLLPLMPSRTSLSLFPPGENEPPALNSYLRTTLGYIILLTPLAANGAIPAARFVFGYCPEEGSNIEAGCRYHLSPDGAFGITVQVPVGIEDIPQEESDQLLFGLSGLEYAYLGTSDYRVVFEGGLPAFIPAVSTTGSEAPNISDALTDTATTSHLTVLSLNDTGPAPVYYAQPREAPLYSGWGERTDGILDYNPMPAYTLTYVPGQLPPVFSAGIYAGVASEDVVLALEVENASLAPFRTYSLGKVYGTNNLVEGTYKSPVRRLRSVDDPLGVTPQGLIAELTPDYKDFDGLLLGYMPGTAYPSIDLTVVQGMLKQTLQSNQLFFVAANADVLMSATSVRYQLTDVDKTYLEALKVPENVINNVFAIAGGIVYDTEGDFIAAIESAAGTYLPDFLRVGGILKVQMDGWTFQLSPRSWRADPDSPTMMLAKFCNRSLSDLINDTSSWLWPEVAIRNNGSLAQTQAALLSIVDAAESPDATDALKIFNDTVLNDPNWNGFLFLNTPVDIAELPDDLKFLTAGIDLTKFYAHHIGLSQTPFSIQSGQPQPEQTAAFGLIDYEDTLDLYADETIQFGFKTMKLSVRFANAALVDFSAEVELMLNELLGSFLTKREAARGNNLIIDGSYQRVGGIPSYSFALTGENVFLANNAMLTEIEVLSVQLITGADAADAADIMTSFILTGNLRFARIVTFDLFSYGGGEGDADSYLRYTGLNIDMKFPLAAPNVQTFTVREGNMNFNVSESNARPSSLMNNFPLAVGGLIASSNLSAEGETPSGQTPEDMGYTSVSAPFDQTPMVPSWYGLVFTLDLGTFGALTGSISFKISILAAWSTGTTQDDLPAYIGLRLPGISAIGGSFPLQGVLKLGFRSFQFETYTTDTDQLAYLLRLRRFAISVLVWSFPPGNTDILLFGQPGNPKGSLGWYAAYDDGKTGSSSETAGVESDKGQKIENKSVSGPVQRRLRSGRRTPPIA